MMSRFESVSEDGFIKIETRMSLSLNLFIISLKKFLLSSQFHPNDDVNASGGSGTRVTCSGDTSITLLIKSSEGKPSILNSIFS